MARQLPFHAFTIKHDRLVNRIVIDIGLSIPFDPNNPPPDDQIDIQSFKALWDTGATGTVLTPTTVQKLGLTPTGVGQSHHAGGISQSFRYLVNLYLPQGVAFSGVQVSDCADTGGFDAIVGMDVIMQGDSVITNHNGHTWLSFRIPSVGTVDYVVEANRTLFAGVGRNSPCPCGVKMPNGRPKKFKECHGA
jgi:hypothetical protein